MVPSDTNTLGISMADLATEICKQDSLHAEGYPYTRNGVRLGIAALEDELGEVWQEWNNSKRALGNARSELRAELMQVAAIAMRIIRSLDAEPID
jgi:NTP pyrophosphatase (non-canonical NTP hydrolase)